MKVLNLLTASIAVVIVEIFIVLAYGVFNHVFSGGQISNIANWTILFLFGAMVLTFAIVIVLGIPIYLLLERKNQATTMTLGIVGFLIPIVMFFVTNTVFSTGGGHSFSQNYYGTHRDMIVSGERTLWGWISYGEDALRFGIHGLIGAIVFGKTMSRLKK